MRHKASLYDVDNPTLSDQLGTVVYALVHYSGDLPHTRPNTVVFFEALEWYDDVGNDIAPYIAGG